MIKKFHSKKNEKILKQVIMKSSYITIFKLITIFLLFPLESLGQDLPPCSKDGFRDGCMGTFVRKDGASYVGPWISDVPQERGTFRRKDGTQYFPSGYIERRDFVDVAPPREIISQVVLIEAKKKCADLGFKSGTEGYGKCVLQLTK